MALRLLDRVRRYLDPLPAAVYLGRIEVVPRGMLQTVLELGAGGTRADETLLHWIGEFITLPLASAAPEGSDHLRLDILIESYSHGIDLMLVSAPLPLLRRPAIAVASRLMRYPGGTVIDTWRVKKKMTLPHFFRTVLSPRQFLRIRTFDEDEVRNLLALALLDTLGHARRRLGR